LSITSSLFLVMFHLVEIWDHFFPSFFQG
jgi:hypothetical protein